MKKCTITITVYGHKEEQRRDPDIQERWSVISHRFVPLAKLMNFLLSYLLIQLD